MTPQQKLYEMIRGLSSDQLVAIIDLIGGGNLDADKNFTRAVLFTEYERRFGGEASS